MIEAVARAIASSENVEDWRSRIPVARAALKAMLDPSPEMLDAALPAETDWGYLPEEWRAMVQHILDEKIETSDAA